MPESVQPGPSQGESAASRAYEARRAAARERAALRKRRALERPACRCDVIHGHCYAAGCPCPNHAEEVSRA